MHSGSELEAQKPPAARLRLAFTENVQRRKAPFPSLAPQAEAASRLRRFLHAQGGRKSLSDSALTAAPQALLVRGASDGLSAQARHHTVAMSLTSRHHQPETTSTQYSRAADTSLHGGTTGSLDTSALPDVLYFPSVDAHPGHAQQSPPAPPPHTHLSPQTDPVPPQGSVTSTSPQSSHASLFGSTAN